MTLVAPGSLEPRRKKARAGRLGTTTSEGFPLLVEAVRGSQGQGRCRWPPRSPRSVPCAGRRRVPVPADHRADRRRAPPARRRGRCAARGRRVVDFGHGRCGRACRPRTRCASCAMRSGLRKPSQRAISSSTVCARNSSKRCTLRCSRHTRFGELAMLGRHLQSLAQRAQRRDAGLLVADVPGQHVRGRQRLAQVVGERGEADQVVARREPRGHVADQFDVHAGVDFGMVLGALRHAVQRFDFGQHHRQRAAVVQRAQERRRALRWRSRDAVPARRARAPARPVRRWRPSRASAPWFPARR